jgi:hypothetical protein
MYCFCQLSEHNPLGARWTNITGKAVPLLYYNMMMIDGWVGGWGEEREIASSPATLNLQKRPSRNHEPHRSQE